MTDKKDDFSPEETAFLNGLRNRVAEIKAGGGSAAKAYQKMVKRTYREAQATRAEYSPPEKSILRKLFGL